MRLFNLEKKNILLISPESWNHVFVSKHHYTIELAKRGNKVFFLNPPSKTSTSKLTKYDHIQIVEYKGFISGLSFFPLCIRKMIQRLVYNKIQTLCNTTFDIVWSFDNSVFYDLDFLPSRVLKISHIVDLNMDFHLARAAESANFCFCTTDQIRDRLITHNSKSFKINHGWSPHNTPVKVYLPGINQIKAIYVGNLSMKYIDWKILLKATQKFPKTDFIFIGPGEDDFNIDQNEHHTEKQLIHDKENVYFLGKIEASQIESYLAKGDLLLIAYQEKHHPDQANPHKVMNYLASGKPIVATYTKEYANLDSIQMSMKNEDWVDLLDNSLKQLPYLSMSEVCEKRKKIAANNTYKKQVNRIEHILNNLEQNDDKAAP